MGRVARGSIGIVYVGGRMIQSGEVTVEFGAGMVQGRRLLPMEERCDWSAYDPDCCGYGLGRVGLAQTRATETYSGSRLILFTYNLAHFGVGRQVCPRLGVYTQEWSDLGGPGMTHAILYMTCGGAE